MKVRTSLFLLSAILAILVVALGFMVLYTSDLTNREVREGDAATRIIKDVFELNIVTYEYMTHHEERMHQQWLLKYDSLGTLLERMTGEEMHPEHLSRLESITSDYESDYMDYSWPKQEYAVTLPQAMLILFEDQARWRIEQGLTDTTEVPNYLNFIYLDALEEVKPEAVTIIR